MKYRITKSEKGYHALICKETTSNGTYLKRPIKRESYFVIKGERILATSRKDAIKRYNHKYNQQWHEKKQ